MKKLVNSKKSVRMILIIITLMLMFNFTMPNYSKASEAGGVLLRPITDLFSTLGDAVCGLLQMCLVDGEFFSSGSVVEGFLVSSSDYPNAADGKYADSEDDPAWMLNCNANESDPNVHKFYTDEIDQEGWDFLNNLTGNQSVAIPVAKYTPDSIFAGGIPSLDINFIKPDDWGGDPDMQNRSVAYSLHKTIATWYVALRNLAVVGLMVILVYVGIRIVISSTASDKAKYKQLMMDWLIAMCILFCLHYIMTFAITITEEISKAISGGNQTGSTIPVIVYAGSANSPGDIVAKFNTNLTGLARFQTKMADGGTKLIYTIMYMALVIYTCMFTFTYLKRVITMAFLTLIAPLVALTYPIDKMNDGKAQAFDMWLKEYVFNALLQPFHLIIYTVLVTSAIELASTNMIYAIVALAFITPAEKLLRKFFGFNKAETAGTLGAFASMAGGAAAYKALGKVANRGGKGGNKGGNGKIRTSNNRQIEDPNAPGGVDGYTGHNGGAVEELGTGDSASDGGQNGYANLSDSELMDKIHDSNKDAFAAADLLDDANDDEDREYLLDEMRKAHEESSRLNEERINRQNQNNNVVAPATDETPEQADAEPEVPPVRTMRLRVKDGFKGAGKAISSKASTTLGNKHWWRQTGKKAAKGTVHLAGRAAATVALGSVGLAAGIAGDDLEDILTYGIGGATLGATVGGNSWNNTLDRAGRGIVNSSPVQGFVEGFTDTTSLERAVARRQSELQADPEFMQQINEDYKDGELKGKELKQATERAAQYATSGVETSKIGKTMKVEDDILETLVDPQMEEEEKRKLARMQATTAAKMAEKIKNPEALVGKKGEEMQQRFADQIQAKNKDLSREEAQANAAEMMKRVRKIKGV